MLSILLLALSLPNDLQLTGLAPGERSRVLAPAAALSPEARAALAEGHELTRAGRVVDAFTARPVSGATVETWTEEIDAVFGGFERVGLAETGVDGRFEVRSVLGGETAGKARVAAPGYLTLSTTAGELDDVVHLFPAEESPARLRILDSEDRPIAGARITSTYSCSHDAPAFDLRTGTDGVVLLPGYGLQDEIPELRVRAQGFAAIEYLDAEPALLHPGEPLTVRLPRRRPFQVRFLDREGKPLAGVPLLIHDDECYHVERTGATGGLQVLTRYGLGPVMFERLTRWETRYLGEFTLPLEHVVTLRVGGDDWPDETPVGNVLIELSGPPELLAEPWGQLFHEDGWTWEGELGEELEFPVGAALLQLGGPFTGSAEVALSFLVLEGEAVLVRPELRPEPRVRVETPPGDWTLWIEAGQDTLEEAPLAEVLPVPADVPLTFFLTGERERRRLRHGPLPAAERRPVVIDLRGAETCLPAAPREDARQSCEVRMEGEPAGVRLGITGPWTGDAGGAVLDGEADGRVIRGRAGAPYLLSLQAEGHARTWARGRLPEAGAPPGVLEVSPVKLASLELDAAFEYRVLAGEELDLERLHPGPLHLILERASGERYALELVLAPGEHRKLELR